jgi:hypothetical protein
MLGDFGCFTGGVLGCVVFECGEKFNANGATLGVGDDGSSSGVLGAPVPDQDGGDGNSSNILVAVDGGDDGSCDSPCADMDATTRVDATTKGVSSEPSIL